MSLDLARLNVARKAVEDVLIGLRDDRISIFAVGGRLPGNGFVVREADGQESATIRLTTADGLRIGIEAYLAATPEEPPNGD